MKKILLVATILVISAHASATEESVWGCELNLRKRFAAKDPSDIERVCVRLEAAEVEQAAKLIEEGFTQSLNEAAAVARKLDSGEIENAKNLVREKYTASITAAAAIARKLNTDEIQTAKALVRKYVPDINSAAVIARKYEKSEIRCATDRVDQKKETDMNSALYACKRT